jgi:hypothetical protein
VEFPDPVKEGVTEVAFPEVSFCGAVDSPVRVNTGTLCVASPSETGERAVEIPDPVKEGALKVAFPEVSFSGAVDSPDRVNTGFVNKAFPSVWGEGASEFPDALNELFANVAGPDVDGAGEVLFPFSVYVGAGSGISNSAHETFASLRAPGVPPVAPVAVSSNDTLE